MEITTIGLDLAKHVFQVHAIAADGTVVLKKRLRRGQVYSFFAALKPCLLGVEACATAHLWARQLRELGHDVKADAGTVRQGLPQARQERRRRCRGHLRGGDTALDALCPDQG